MGYTSLMRWIDASLRILYSFVQNLYGSCYVISIQAVFVKICLDEMRYDTTFLIVAKDIIVQDYPAICFRMATEPLLDAMSAVVDPITSLTDDMQTFPFQLPDEI